MGFDCTLHVIDEGLITAEFIPMLLGDDGPTGAFAKRNDAAELLKTVRDSLRDGSPEEAASMACQLALTYCGASLPYHYERGFAVSLWDEMPEGPTAKPPKKHFGSVAQLMAPVCARHPRLRGHFYDRFTGNFSTGRYVPADNIPAFRKWAHGKVKRFAKPDRRLFRGLMLVLDEAERSGLGYWEGTDLPLPMQTMYPPADQRTPGLEDTKAPVYASDIRGAFGNRLYISSAVGMDSTWVCDAGIRPVRFEKLRDEYCTGMDCWNGHSLTIASHGEVELTYPSGIATSLMHFEIRYRPRADEQAYTVIPLEGLLPPNRAQWTAFFAGGIVAEPAYVWGHSGERVPYWGKLGETLKPVGDLPAAKDIHPNDRYPDDHGWMTPAVVRMTDSREVFLWDEKGYEVIDGKWIATFDSSARTTRREQHFHHGRDNSNPFTYLPESDESFLLLLDSRLQRWRRGQTPVPLLPDRGLHMGLHTGPHGSILITESWYFAKRFGCLFFEAHDTIIPIETDVFADEDPETIQYLIYISATRKLLAITPDRVWSVPIEHVLAQPAYRASTGRKLRVPPDLTTPA